MFSTDLTEPVAWALDRVLARRSGLILIAGPTGQGKTAFFDIMLLGRLNQAAASRNVFVGDIREGPTLQTAVHLAAERVAIGVLRVPGGVGALHRVIALDAWGKSAPLPMSLISLRLGHLRAAQTAPSTVRIWLAEVLCSVRGRPRPASSPPM